MTDMPTQDQAAPLPRLVDEATWKRELAELRARRESGDA